MRLLTIFKDLKENFFNEALEIFSIEEDSKDLAAKKLETEYYTNMKLLYKHLPFETDIFLKKVLIDGSIRKDDVLYTHIELISRFGVIKASEENENPDVTNISFDKNFIMRFLQFLQDNPEIKLRDQEIKEVMMGAFLSHGMMKSTDVTKVLVKTKLIAQGEMKWLKLFQFYMTKFKENEIQTLHNNTGVIYLASSLVCNSWEEPFYVKPKVFHSKETYQSLGRILEAPEIINIVKEVENLGIQDHSLDLDIVTNLIKEIPFEKTLEQIENKVGQPIINNALFKHNLAELYNKTPIISTGGVINPNRVSL
jgi:hypothetical protein